MTAVKETRQGDVTVWAISGDLDAQYEQEMLAKIEDLMGRNEYRIVLDLSKMTLIDSAGVGMIVTLLKRARAHSGDAKLSTLIKQPKEVFKLLRLDKTFDVHPTVDDAIKAFSR